MDSTDNTSTNTPFAGLLRSSRLAAGLTQEELAEAAQMSSRALGNLERGRTTPHRSTVDRLARALGADDVLLRRLRRLAHGRPLPANDASPVSTRAGRACELPPDTAEFVGRQEELASLHEVLDGRSASGAKLCLLVGPAGAGKTALAVHFARRVAASFPDGTLYCDLRGSGGHPPTPAEVLQGFLRVLAPRSGTVPDRYDELVGMFQSHLADRSLLIVLDGADSAAPLRGFVPSGQRSFVIATSRRRLESLDVRQGVRRITVGGLDPHTAAGFVAAAGGSGCSPEVAGRIAQACGNLPFALRVAAIRAVRGPGFRAVADELADPRTRLAALSTADPEHSVESLLAEAHDALDPVAATLFRRLGLHPSRRIDVPAAAAAGGVHADQVRQVLSVLLEHHLAEHVRGETYQLSELAYCYASNRVRREEPVAEIAEVHRRLARWYLVAADAADRVLSSGRFRAGLDAVMADGIQPPRFADREQALSWCDEHRAVLASVAQTAARSDAPSVAWQLPWALGGYFDLRRPASDWLRTHEIGLAAARREHDLLGQAVMLVGLGHAHYYPRRFDDAAACYAEATALWRQLGDRRGEAVALNSTANVYLETRQLRRAIAYYEQALTAFRDIGDRRGEGVVLGNLAETCCELGDHVAAAPHAMRALAISRETASSRSECLALCQLARAEAATSSPDKARELFRQALGISRDAADRHAEAWTLTYIGEHCASEGAEHEAMTMWEAAIRLFDALDDPQADRLRGRLVSMADPRPDSVDEL